MGAGKTLLFVGLGLLCAVFVAAWVRAWHDRSGGRGGGIPDAWELAVGAVTNFFDTLGIGSFAPTTSAWKLRGTVPDERIPGSLNVGHTLPVIAQAFIFIVVVDVGAGTLISMIAAAWPARGSAPASLRGCRSDASRSAWALPSCSRPRSSP